jgi:hypothetical protein
MHSDPGGYEKPLSLYPGNPHYFLYKGKPLVLISAGEHYGAVLNLDFDFIPYLDTLQRHQLNLTRLFSGAYVENENDIAWMQFDNTLAPRPNSYSAPWRRSDTDGYVNGGGKFDLNRWDETYFQRLKDFIRAAARRDILVEYVFFSQMYGISQWKASPLNANNNIHGVGRGTWDRFTSLDDEDLAERQEQLVRKVARELNSFSNLYYEICNEPNSTGEQAGISWHNRMIDSLVSEEAGLPGQHLVAVNYDQPYALQRIHPHVSICNTHYTWGDGWVGALELLDSYYEKPLVLALDETIGFPVHLSAAQARVEAWEAIIGGCAVYDHLSWAYTPDDEKGDTEEHRAFLAQLEILAGFMKSLDFTAMTADKGILASGFYEDVHVRALVTPGQAYAIYMHHGRRDKHEADTRYLINESNHISEIGLWIPAGSYVLEWLKPETGETLSRQLLEHPGKVLELVSPEYTIDIVLRIRKKPPVG